jgi:hypothetical protein
VAKSNAKPDGRDARRAFRYNQGLRDLRDLIGEVEVPLLGYQYTAEAAKEQRSRWCVTRGRVFVSAAMTAA